MHKFAVIGFPIGHTMSPFIHSRLFKLSKYNAEYNVIEIKPSDLSHVFHESLRLLNGFNITIPYKQNIIPLIDETDNTAEKYKAVNTVKCSEQVVGYNTDAYGFLKSLDIGGISLSGNVIVCGCGGVARAIAYEALIAGCNITFAVRKSSIPSAEKLADELKNAIYTANIKIELLDTVSDDYDLLINATPIGMYPNIDAIPISEKQLAKCKAVFDAVYNPTETKLIATAERLGIKAIGGMPMLVWQAVRAHEIWYNATFKTNDVEKIIEDSYTEISRVFND